MPGTALAKRFRPPEPEIRFAQKGKYLITYLTINPAPGVVQTFKSRTNLEAIERRFRSGNVGEIEGIFGDIWKGIKKGVKKVGKAIGIKKIVKGIKKVAKIPGISAIPYVGPALKAVDVGSDLATAIIAKKKGRPKLAKKAARIAMRRAKKYKLSKRRVKREAKKIYKLIIAPN